MRYMWNVLEKMQGWISWVLWLDYASRSFLSDNILIESLLSFNNLFILVSFSCWDSKYIEDGQEKRAQRNVIRHRTCTSTRRKGQLSCSSQTLPWLNNSCITLFIRRDMRNVLEKMQGWISWVLWLDYASRSFLSDNILIESLLSFNNLFILVSFSCWDSKYIEDGQEKRAQRDVIRHRTCTSTRRKGQLSCSSQKLPWLNNSCITVHS